MGLSCTQDWGSSSGFGDLHGHTARSFDAYAYGTRATPEDAFRFARGIPVPLASSTGTPRTVRLDRLLDFAAVTDHQELLGELELCLTLGSVAYDNPLCEGYRRGEQAQVVQFGVRLANENPTRFSELCGPTGEVCREAARRAWQRLRDAAEEAYDRSAECRFTAFAGLEYTNSANITNLHRNVVFRNASVPDLPPSCFEAPSPLSLLRALAGP